MCLVQVTSPSVVAQPDGVAPFVPIPWISAKDNRVTMEASVNPDLVGFDACAPKVSRDPIAGST